MKELIHSIPVHNYFMLFQPPTPDPHYQLVGQEYVIRNHKTKEIECKAKLVDTSKIKLQDLPDSYCLLVYGIRKAKLVQLFIDRYPSIRSSQQIQVLLFQKIVEK